MRKRHVQQTRRRCSRRRGFVLPLASAGAAGGKLDGLTRVSRDNIVDGMALHQSEMQPSLAADGTKKTLVGAFEVGRIYNGGSSAIGFAAVEGRRQGLARRPAAADDRRQADDDAARHALAGGRSVRGVRREPRDCWLISVDRAGLRPAARSASSSTARRTATEVGGRRSSRTRPATGDAPQNGSLACDNYAGEPGLRQLLPRVHQRGARLRRTSLQVVEVDRRRRDVVGAGRRRRRIGRAPAP